MARATNFGAHLVLNALVIPKSFNVSHSEVTGCLVGLEKVLEELLDVWCGGNFIPKSFNVSHIVNLTEVFDLSSYLKNHFAGVEADE